MKNKDSLKAVLLRIHHRVRKHFVERREEVERWQMPPPGYNGEQLILDDCDGFCLAVRKLLRKAAVPSRLVYCEINGMGHLVVEVEGWILDNRQSTVVPNRLLTNYRWLRISGFEPGEPWREVLG